MTDFANVTVVRKANIYFDGGVTSRTINFPSGEVKTLGVILPGEYKFDTAKKEIMEIQSGDVEVMPAGTTEWQRYSAGSVFEIPANSSFFIKALTIADYCCSFVDE